MKTETFLPLIILAALLFYVAVGMAVNGQNPIAPAILALVLLIPIIRKLK